MTDSKVSGAGTGNKRPKVVVTRKLPDSIETRMAELFDVDLNLTDTPMDAEALAAAVKRADVLVPTVTDNLDASIINQAGNQLKLIANFGAGVDHLDVIAAHNKGIKVSNTPGVLTDDTADLAMALLLSVPRRIFEGERILRDGRWTGWTPTFLMGSRLSGKRLGIVGLGRIGQAVAHRAKAFGLSIHYHSRKRAPDSVEEELGATYWQDLDAMLGRIDFLSIHCPLTPSTKHLIDRQRLKAMQPHAILVNTARGGIVDEKALADFLDSGRLAGAGLDVFEEEPAINETLLTLDNVVLLPHMGSSTREARIAMGEKVLINIRTFMDGHSPPDRVLPRRTTV